MTEEGGKGTFCQCPSLHRNGGCSNLLGDVRLFLGEGQRILAARYAEDLGYDFLKSPEASLAEILLTQPPLPRLRPGQGCADG